MALAPYLTCHNLKFEMGHRTFFQNLSFSVHPGERWGIVGPNGAGKTTFFNLLTEKLIPDSGVISVRNGIRIAIIRQEFQFDEGATVEDHIRAAIGFDTQTLTIQIENEIEKLGEDAGNNPQLVHNEQWINRIEQLQNKLVELDGISTQNILESVIKVGRFDGIEQQLVASLSGGQQKRLQIVSALLTQPQLILLDEPTNHLDVQTVDWLEEFLLQVAEQGSGLLGFRDKQSQSEPVAYVIISHDRALLDTLVTQILEIDGGQGRTFTGNFESYMEQKIQLEAAAQKQVSRMANLYRRELSWLRAGTKARTTKQVARIERAQSLGKNLKIEKENTQATKKAEISFDSQMLSYKRNESDQFVPVVQSLGSQQLIVCKDVDLPYPSQSSRFILKSFNYSLRAGQRLALLGPNGSGKTTIMRMIIGEVLPNAGSIVNHELLNISYFDQARATLPDSKVRDIICPSGDSVSFQGRQIHIMSYLDRFLFTKSDSEKLVHELSGGERARLLLAQLMLKDANTLILDEPTNDLDINTLQMLESNLIDFKGGIVFTSHDRYFIQKVATDILAYCGELELKGQKVAVWQLYKDLDQALDAMSRIEISNIKQKQQIPSSSAIEKPIEKNVTKQKISFKETREFENLEKQIAFLESQIEIKTKELDSAYSTSKDFNTTSKIADELKKFQMELDSSVKRWEAIFEKM